MANALPLEPKTLFDPRTRTPAQSPFLSFLYPRDGSTLGVCDAMVVSAALISFKSNSLSAEPGGRDAGVYRNKRVH